jgi:hypothetical protein
MVQVDSWKKKKDVQIFFISCFFGCKNWEICGSIVFGKKKLLEFGEKLRKIFRNHHTSSIHGSNK